MIITATITAAIAALLKSLHGFLWLPVFGVLSPRIRGLNTIIWGTNGCYTGIIVSARNMRTGDMDVIPDNIGFAAAKVYFNTRNECEIEALLTTDVTPPAIGDMITAFTSITNCLVDDIEKRYEQKGVAKYSLKLSAYDGITS
jgi:hypothetical protein